MRACVPERKVKSKRPRFDTAHLAVIASFALHPCTHQSRKWRSLKPESETEIQNKTTTIFGATVLVTDLVQFLHMNGKKGRPKVA